MMERTRYLLPAIVLTALLACACKKETAQGKESDVIAFYIKATYGAGTKTAIEDTDALLRLGPPIFVTNNSDTTVFSNTKLTHTGNGVWRSNVDWVDGKEYTLYAYIASPYPNTGDTGGPYVSVSNKGQNVKVTQPAGYSEEPDNWADYLLSYRVLTNGSDKGLVKLDMERVTAGVEIYMSKGPDMASVKLHTIEIRNIYREAAYALTGHAVPGDPAGIYGTKNSWFITLSGTNDTDYSCNPEIELNTYDNTAGRFDPDSKVMSFLTVDQNLTSDTELYIKYTSIENGTATEHEDTFKLNDYSPHSWKSGNKTRYYISVNTGIELEGIVSEWETVDFIEGTLLPR